MDGQSRVPLKHLAKKAIREKERGVVE